MFEGISIAETFSKVKEIEKGMSGDRKYYIETIEGRKLLLRITEVSNYETKKKDYDFLLSLNKADLPVPKAIDFGTCEEGNSVYMLWEWMEGEEAEKVVPNMVKEKQYEIGVKSGQILRGIHESSKTVELEKFINIGIEHPAFAAGKIDGYFNHQDPEEFWRMLALYLAMSAITSIVWVKYFASDRLDSILELNRNVVRWYDGMKKVIPSWYREYRGNW